MQRRIVDAVNTDGFRRALIDHNATAEEIPTSVTDRLALLDRKVASGEKPASEYVRELFPGIAAAEQRESIPPFPEKAPLVWKRDRLPDEDPPSFIRRAYGPWIGNGLGKHDIRHLDFRLYEAVYTWRRVNEWPEDLPLPTIKEKVSRRLEALERGASEGFSLGPRDIQSLASAVQRRHTSQR